MLGPVPATGRFGLTEADPDEVGRLILAGWDAFLDVVGDPSTDLSRPSRLAGWSGKDLLIHLGAWDDAPGLASVLESAREGAFEPAIAPDAANEALVAAHRSASLGEVLRSLELSRQRIEDFFDGPDLATYASTLSRSSVGPLPVLSLLHAGTYELAVHALDLGPCGAPEPAPELLDRGLAALLDVTGALAARVGVDITVTAMTPTGGWRFTSGTDGWTTEPAEAGRFDGVGVRGTAADLLDTSAGRAHLAQLLLSRRLQVQQLPQFMRLAPLLEQVPGLPGGPALRGAVGGLSGVAGGVGKVLGRFRR